MNSEQMLLNGAAMAAVHTQICTAIFHAIRNMSRPSARLMASLGFRIWSWQSSSFIRSSITSGAGSSAMHEQHLASTLQSATQPSFSSLALSLHCLHCFYTVDCRSGRIRPVKSLAPEMYKNSKWTLYLFSGVTSFAIFGWARWMASDL